MVTLSDALAALSDKNAPVPFSKLVGTLETELGESLCRQFRRIDPVPVGVGTVAQVHRATLLNGQELALKIKMPNVERVFLADLKVARILIPVLQFFVPFASKLKSCVNWYRLVGELTDKYGKPLPHK